MGKLQYTDIYSNIVHAPSSRDPRRGACSGSSPSPHARYRTPQPAAPHDLEQNGKAGRTLPRLQQCSLVILTGAFNCRPDTQGVHQDFHLCSPQRVVRIRQTRILQWHVRDPRWSRQHHSSAVCVASSSPPRRRRRVLSAAAAAPMAVVGRLLPHWCRRTPPITAAKRPRL
jgi:hypothetical protein